MKRIIKRLLPAFLCIVMIIGTVGCGAKKAVWTGAVPESRTDEDKEKETEKKTEKETEKATEKETEKETEKQDTKPLSTGKINGDGTIGTEVIYDKDGIVIKILSLTYSNNNAVVSLEISNKTKDEIVVRGMNNGYAVNYINQYMYFDGFITSEAEAGETKTEEFDIPYFEAYGIEKIGEISLGFVIYDEDYEDIDEVTAVFKRDSYTEADDTYQKAIEDGSFEKVMHGEIENIKKYDRQGKKELEVLSEVIFNSNDYTYFLIEVCNNSDTEYTLQLESMTVNGFQISDGYLDIMKIMAGKTAIMEVSLTYYLDYKMYYKMGNDGIDVIEYDLKGMNWESGEELESLRMTCRISEKMSPINTEGTKVYDKNDITVWYMGCLDDDYYEENVYVTFLIYNSGKESIYVSTEDTVFVNGKEIEVYSGEGVDKGNYASVTVELYGDDLEEAGIKTVESIDIQFIIKDDNYKDTDKFEVSIK